ncbi:unnamed protein product [Amoebophrya sp. A120]|nr:unnamed protein product [Amoebophrya sp. A120]|eukprot:GSA120T00002874001.1
MTRLFVFVACSFSVSGKIAIPSPVAPIHDRFPDKSVSSSHATGHVAQTAQAHNETGTSFATSSKDAPVSLFRLPKSAGNEPLQQTGTSGHEDRSGLQLDPAALAELQTLPWPFYAAAAIGPARVGKSFWLGQIARLLNRNVTKLFEVSDTSESCTSGAWFLSVDLAKADKHILRKNAALENFYAKSQKSHRNQGAGPPQRGTLLLFDLQGSDKGSAADLQATDYLSAFVALFASRSLFFFEKHVEFSKAAFYERIAYAGKVLKNNPNFVPAVSFVVRRPMKLPKKYATREQELADVLNIQTDRVINDAEHDHKHNYEDYFRVFELPELDVEDSSVSETWAEKLLQDAVLGLDGKDTNYGSTLPSLQTSDGTVLDAAGLIALMEEIASWLRTSNADQFFQVQDSVREKVCRSRMQDLVRRVFLAKKAKSTASEKDEQSAINVEELYEDVAAQFDAETVAWFFRETTTGQYEINLKTDSLNRVEELHSSPISLFLVQNGGLRRTFFDWCTDKAVRTKALTFLRDHLAKVHEQRRGFFNRFKSFLALFVWTGPIRAVEGCVESFSRILELLFHRRTLLVLAAIFVVAVGAVFLPRVGAGTTTSAVSFKQTLLATAFRILTTLLTVTSRLLFAIFPCFFLGNKHFRKYWDPVVDASKELLQRVFEYACEWAMNERGAVSSSHPSLSSIDASVLAASGSNLPTFAASTDHPEGEKTASAGSTTVYGSFSSTSSTYCSYAGFFVVEFFGRNIDYLLYGLFLAILWYAVPLLTQAFLRGILNFLVYHVFGQSSFDSEMMLSDEEVEEEFLAQDDSSPTSSYSPKSPEQKTTSLYRASRAPSLFHYLKHNFLSSAALKRIIYEKWLQYEKRPQLVNRRAVWDLNAEQHRSFTEQQIELLTQSPEYKWRCGVLKQSQEVPKNWEWKAHYLKFADKSAPIKRVSRSKQPEDAVAGEVLQMYNLVNAATTKSKSTPKKRSRSPRLL